MRAATERSKRRASEKPIAASVVVEPEREADVVEPEGSVSREERRERRAARRAQAEAEAGDSVPIEHTEQIPMSPWVPIVWFVVPLALAIAWSLIDRWLNP